MSHKPHTNIARLATVALSSCALAFVGFATVAAVAAGLPGDPAITKNASALFHDPQTQVLGNPHGDVTIVEFFDYACPTCKATEPRVEQLLKADHGVKLIVKEFPVLSPQSAIASKVALAAVKQGRYAAYHQALLSYRGGLNEAVIYGVAHDVGLNVTQLRKDMNAPEISREIAANLALAQTIHVPGTPTFILRGRMLPQPTSQIDFPSVVAAARHDRA